MGQDAGDWHAPAGPMPERFEVFHLREYPKVVGLLHGLLAAGWWPRSLLRRPSWSPIGTGTGSAGWTTHAPGSARSRSTSGARSCVPTCASRHGKATPWCSTRTTGSSWPTTTRRSGRRSAPCRRPGTGAGHHQGPAAPRPPQAGPAAGHGRQVDAASRLREIVWHAGRPVAHGRAPLLPDEPWETPELLEASLVPPAPPRPGPQRLALVVNLLLVLGLGVVLGVAASYVLDADSTVPARRPAPLTPQRPAPPSPNRPGSRPLRPALRPRSWPTRSSPG
jgi:hypothetical protein